MHCSSCQPRHCSFRAEFGASAPFLYFADHEGEPPTPSSRGGQRSSRSFPALRQRRRRRVCPRRTIPRPSNVASCDGKNGTRTRRIAVCTQICLRCDTVTRPFVNNGRALLTGPCWGTRRSSRVCDARRSTNGCWVNFGPDLVKDSFAEPLVAPPVGCVWRMHWSSEEVFYGGVGASHRDRERLARARSLNDGARTEAADEARGTEPIIRRVSWEPTDEGRHSLVWKEWIVTNGLGGYRPARSRAR